MSKGVYIQISVGLRDLILEEKRTLRRKEDKKISSRRRIITNIIASNSLARKIRKC